MNSCRSHWDSYIKLYAVNSFMCIQYTTFRFFFFCGAVYFILGQANAAILFCVHLIHI